MLFSVFMFRVRHPLDDLVGFTNFNEFKANQRKGDTSSLLTFLGLLFRAKSYVRLMIGCMHLSMIVSIFCILKSLDFELDLIFWLFQG